MSTLARPLQALPGAVVALLGALLMPSCGGSGGGGGAYEASATLLELRFPDPNGMNAEPEEEAPQNAPLDQALELVFSGRPDPARVGPSTLAIRDARGFPVPGTYVVEGNRVRFTPALPTGSIDATSSAIEDRAGNAGLRPGARYTLVLDRTSWPFLADVAADVALRHGTGNPGQVSLAFQTTTVPRDLFRGQAARLPRRLATVPVDGAMAVSPQLYGDPAGRFVPRGAFTITYDGPVHPDDTHLGQFQLVDLEDPAHPGGLVLGTDVSVLVNTPHQSVVVIQASGILPLGHLLCLEEPGRVRGLGQRQPAPAPGVVVASFTVEDASPGSVSDLLEEDFDTEDRRGTDPADLPPGMRPAEWDRINSNVLRAAAVFDGDGLLGRFVPPPPPNPTTPRIVILDTSLQVFPLFDGSTPEAPTGHRVLGGRFDFTDIDIPDGVIVTVRGPNPLVFTATGTVRIAGQIVVEGQNGTSDSSFDSAQSPIPGGPAGPGGGRGGVSHPIHYWPPGQLANTSMVSPPRGGDGYGPGGLQDGGRGGESGILDDPDASGDYGTDQEITCRELNGNGNGDYAAGGSGGAMRRNGKQGRTGRGSVRPDGTGNWLLRVPSDGPSWNVLQPGAAGAKLFRDEDPDNNFIGSRGELPDVLGGQGGGGGGSRSEAYYCGRWCKVDQDPTNDVVCMGGEANIGPKWGDSVGDARGGGGGGGGGAVLIQVLGDLEVAGTGALLARGGRGGGGEALGGSGWGGPGGGGAGGAIVLQAGGTLTLRDGCLLDVRGGLAQTDPLGSGGDGQVQLQVPPGQVAVVEPSASILPKKAWFDPSNTLAPAEFTQFSLAVSEWWDMGRTTERPPSGSHPVFRFRGLGPGGLVRTDALGNVLNPTRTDVRCDYLGQVDPLRPGEYLPGKEPRADFIPPNATVRIEFQSGAPVVPGSSEVDPASITPWTPAVSIADGRQFVRYRITFDLTADGSVLAPGLPRPSVQGLSIRAGF